MVAGIRSWLFDRGVLRSQSYPLPVIGVGNLAVGGTGKTPHVEYLLRLLHQEGLRVAMLSRGYGRKTRGYILAEKRWHTAADIGDEPYQMMHNCPFATIAVCEKRTVGMEHLLKLTPRIDVVVLDDAYQHRYVKPGLNILLTDAHRLYTHDHLLPWGQLRERPSAAQRAQLVVVTKCLAGERPSLPIAPGQQLFYSQICYGNLLNLKGQKVKDVSLEGQRILLIVGIANPAPLQQHLQQQGAWVVSIVFPDHHAFSAKDAQQMNALYEEQHCTMALTTQKDSTRLRAIQSQLSEPLKQNLLIQPITVQIEAAEEATSDQLKQTNNFNQTIIHYVRTNKRNRSVD